MTRSIAMVDASVLVAASDSRTPDHDPCAAVLRRRDLAFVIPTLVVAEATYLIGSRLGGRSEAALLRRLQAFAIESPLPDNWPAIADLVERYADLQLGTADAAIVVLADRLKTDIVVTLDRRHFGVVRSPDGRAFHLLPELPAIHEEPATYRAYRASRSAPES